MGRTADLKDRSCQSDNVSLCYFDSLTNIYNPSPLSWFFQCYYCVTCNFIPNTGNKTFRFLGLDVTLIQQRKLKALSSFTRVLNMETLYFYFSSAYISIKWSISRYYRFWCGLLFEKKLLLNFSQLCGYLMLLWRFQVNFGL